MPAFSPCSHKACPEYMGREAEGILSCLFFIRTFILLDQGPSLIPSFNPSCFLKGPISKYSPTGLKLQCMNFGDTNIRSLIPPEENQNADSYSTCHVDNYTPFSTWFLGYCWALGCGIPNGHAARIVFHELGGITPPNLKPGELSNNQ